MAQIQISEVILEDQPVAYWRLDETDVTNAALNNSGTQNVPANFVGDTDGGDFILGEPGLADPDNAAVRFEGFAGYIQIPDSAFINNGGPYLERSVELWFSAEDAFTPTEMVLFEEGGTTRGSNIYIRDGSVFVGAWNRGDDDAGVSSPWISGADDPAGGNLYLSAPIESNTTYHVAFVMDGDEDGKEGTLKGYLNGELFGEKTGVGRLFTHGDNNAIGGMLQNSYFDTGAGSGDGNYFWGVLDEIAVYDKALSATRIAVRNGLDITPGDFNFDGDIDLGDFAVMAENFNQPGEFEQGDNNFDGVVDLHDFFQWRQIFNGEGPTATAPAAVPEPTTGMLLGLGCLALSLLGRRRVILAGVAGILLSASGVSQAQDDVLLLSVNRGTGATQIKNTTGGQLSLDGYLMHSDSGLLSPPTWTSLNSQQFAGWTVANPNEQAISELNLIGSSTLEAGGSLSLGSAYNGLGILPHQEDVGFQFSTPAGNVVDGMVEFVGASRVPTITVDRATGSVMLSNPSDGTFTIDSYSIASPNGLLARDGWTSLASQQVAGWTEANPRVEQLTELNLTSSSEFAPRGGFDLGSVYNAAAAAHPTEEDLTLQYSTPDGKLLDGIVEFTGPLNDLVLSVNTESGEANLQNLSSFIEFDVTGYSVLSESGALSVDGWTSLASSGLGGEGWSEANPTAEALAELNPTGSTLFSGGTVISLGSIFSSGGAEDLMLQFSTTSGVQFGSVQYTGGGLGLDCNGDGAIDVFDANCATVETLDATLAAAGLLKGDADGDGEVQFSDFVILADNFTMAGKYTDGDFDKDGEVQFSDFVILADNFGISSGAAAAVPEPSTVLLASFGCLAWTLGLRRRRVAAVVRPWRRREDSQIRDSATTARFSHVSLVLGLTASLSVCLATDLTGQTITTFQTGFEYDLEPLVFLPSDLNGATGQIGAFSGEPFPEGDPTAGEDHQYIPEPDSVGFVDNPDGGRMLWVDRPTDSGTFFADLSEDVILPGAVFSFQVGTRRTQGNSEAKDYDIFGLDSSGEESFHLRVSADSNIERLGYVTDDGNTVSFDFPTTLGEDGNDDLLNIGAPAFTASDRIADITVRMAPAGYLVDFDNGSNAYTTELLSYNGSATELSQIGFTYRGVFGATAEQSGHVLDNLLVEGRTEPVTLGDFNADGNIDMGDFAVLAENFVTGTTFEQGDNNFDGRVNLHDFVEFKALYNAAQGGVAAVPEPNGLALILAGGALMLGACRNRRRLGTKCLSASARVTTPRASAALSLLAILFVAALTVPASAQWPDVILEAEPFAYYRLDEPDGTTNLTNLGTEAVPANYEGDLTLGVPGLADPGNSAVRFEGFDGRVNIPDTAFTNNGGPHAQKTFEFWFSADDPETPVEMVLFEEGGSTRGINAYVRDGSVFVGAWNAADDDGALTTPWPGGVGADREGYFLSAPIQSNTPYHVAMVMDGDDDGREGSLSLYVNGELAAQQATGVGLLFGHTDDTSIGGVSAQTLFDTGDTGQTNNHFFLGVIDEFALYNVALSADRLFVHAGNQIAAGDFNLDGSVDLTDFGILSDNFGTGTSFAQGDNNLDGMVGIQDFIEFKAVFNAAPAGAAVPEPSSLSLICLAGAALSLVAGSRRRG